MEEKEKQEKMSLIPAAPKSHLLDIEPDSVKRKLDAIHKFQAIIKNQLKEDHDFGVIPGTNKPTLLKPGAEKIAKLLNCFDDYEEIGVIEDWEKPFFHYKIKCTLIDMETGTKVSSGIGECNSMESKYRYRWIPEWELSEEQKAVKNQVPYKEKSYRDRKGKFKIYRFENDDIYSQVNTLLKMAKKRALIDAALSAGRLSDLFTQDLEDIVPNDSAEIKIEPENHNKKAKVKFSSPDQQRAVMELIDRLKEYIGDQAVTRAVNYIRNNFKKKSFMELTEKEADKLIEKIEKELEKFENPAVADEPPSEIRNGQ